MTGNKKTVRYGRRRSIWKLKNMIANLKLPTKQDRIAYLRELRRAFQAGEIMVEPDDPRTTAGFTAKEVRFIRGEGCDLCGQKCLCDEKYRALQDMRIA